MLLENLRKLGSGWLGVSLIVIVIVLSMYKLAPDVSHTKSSHTSDAAASLISLTDSMYTNTIEWQVAPGAVDSLTKAEVLDDINRIFGEDGYPKKIVVFAKHVDNAVETFLSYSAKDVYNRIALSPKGDTLYIEPIKSLNAPFPGSMEYVLGMQLAKVFTNEDDD